jgi:DNA-binding IclR family transcriptional regulator
MRDPILEEAIRTTALEAFLETGKALDVNEIATRLGWSASKVRRVLVGAHGCVDGLMAHQESRASYSMSYRNTQSGAHRVWVYKPTLETLRDMINDLRKTR